MVHIHLHNIINIVIQSPLAAYLNKAETQGFAFLTKLFENVFVNKDIYSKFMLVQFPTMKLTEVPIIHEVQFLF